MSDKKADSQARAELLGRLIEAAGEQPYMLVHGEGRACRHLILLRVAEDEVKELSTAWKRELPPVVVGAFRFLPLPLDEGAQPGDVPADLYDSATRRWKGSIAVRRFK